MFYTIFKLWVWGHLRELLPAERCHLSCHTTALCECIHMLDTKVRECTYFLFYPSLPSSLPCLSLPVGRLVWEERNPEAEMRAEGTEKKRHLQACWQERERRSRNIKKFLSFKRKRKRKKKRAEKQENEAAPKYLHFLLPMFDILSVCMCFISLEVTEKF